jgi:hypothetical protein
MTGRDRFTLVLLGFFFAVACTLEAYFLYAHAHLAGSGHPFAKLFAIYGPSDRAYYDQVSPLALALEGLNVLVTQPLGVWLAYAIVRRRPYRWALQLAVGAYLSYSVVLYFLVAQVSGFATMTERTPRTFALFYGANLPWLVGYGWMAWEAARQVTARFRSAPAVVERDGIAPVVEKVGE